MSWFSRWQVFGLKSTTLWLPDIRLPTKAICSVWWILVLFYRCASVLDSHQIPSSAIYTSKWHQLAGDSIDLWIICL